MSDEIFIGNAAGDVSVPPKFDPITKVVIDLDGTNIIEAGTDTGRTFELSCPYGTQQMANNILAALSNYEYQPVTASDVLTDPAIELGDAMTVGGAYSVIAQRNIDFDAMMAMELDAPGQEEIESEYPYTSQQQSETDRKIAQNSSEIRKTAEEIGLRVDGLEGQYTDLKVTLDGVTISGPDGTTLINGGKIDASELKVDAANITGTLQANQINMTGSITWADLSSDTQGEITDAQDAASAAQSTANRARSTANSAQTAANSANNTISAWTYPGTTEIDGREIRTGTVTASTLRGGTVQLLNNSGGVSGTFTLAPATSASYSVDISSGAALRLRAQSGVVWIQSSTGSYLNVASNVVVGTNLQPAGDNNYSCGVSGARWSTVYAATGYIQTSDRNYKEDINYDLSAYDKFFDSLKPASCKYIDGTSGRKHIVLVSQDVESELEENGLTSLDFGGFIKSPKQDATGKLYPGEYLYALRYDEFVGLLIDQVQRLKKRVEQMEEHNGTAGN